MELTLVFRIMKATGVFPSCDDWGVGMAGGIVLFENVFNFGLYLILEHVGAHCLKATSEGF